MNILIVDDNEMTRSVLRTILVGAGHVISAEASTGKGGLERAIKLQPDIVCLDIDMPDASGVEILTDIVKELPDTVVLMISGKRDVDTIKQCLSLGARGFIIKPFNAVTVLKVLGDAIIRAEQE